MLDTDVCVNPSKNKDIIPFSYSRKGLNGNFDKEHGRVYEAREGSLVTIFPPHRALSFKQDAPCVVLATLRNGLRKNTHVIENTGVGFDIDAGMTIEEGLSLAKASGFECLLYSSYNHQPQHTIIEEEKISDADALMYFTMLKEASAEGRLTVAQRKLVVEPLRPFVTGQGIVGDFDIYLHKRVAKWKPPVDGMFIPDKIEYGLHVTHAPILSKHKFRIVFLFASPFVGTVREYRAAIDAFAKHIGIRHVVDEKAKNANQALYVPSCANSNKSRAVYEVINRGSERVELRDYVPADWDDGEAGDGDEPVDPYDEAQIVAALKRVIPRLLSIRDDLTFSRSFYFTFKRSFKAVKFIRSLSGDRAVSFKQEAQLLEMECPFGHTHSTSPLGGYVGDANDERRGWIWHCHHQHSGIADYSRRPRTTPAFLAEALRQKWFTRNDMFKPEFFNNSVLGYDLARMEA